MKVKDICDIADLFTGNVEFVSDSEQCVAFTWGKDEDGYSCTNYENIWFIGLHDVENMTVKNITACDNKILITID